MEKLSEKLFVAKPSFSQKLGFAAFWLLLAALLLTACDGGEEEAAQATATAQTQETAAIASTTAAQSVAATGTAQVVMAALTAEARATPTPDVSVNTVAQAAFEQWAQTNGEPYRDARFDVEADDGFFARLRATAWFRPGMDAPWEERDALLECRQVGSQWQCDQRFDFGLTGGERARRANATATAETQAAVAAAVEATAAAVAVRATLTAIAPQAKQIADATGMEFVYVPAGEFTMGSPDGEGNDDEHPQHAVTLDDYWIGKTEVTNAQYGLFVEAGGYAQERYWTGDGWAWRVSGNLSAPVCWDESVFNQPQQPVVCVSWYEAVAYSRWLSEQAGGTVRLPTEAEWEKAARGSDGRRYPWGNTDPNDRLLNFNDNVGSTVAVGSYPEGASPYGALDMAGNAWEWTADWYDADYYGQSPALNPTGPESGDRRVLRGGSSYDIRNNVRCAYRLGFDPDDGFWYVGFRLLSPGS